MQDFLTASRPVLWHIPLLFKLLMFLLLARALFRVFLKVKSDFQFIKRGKGELTTPTLWTVKRFFSNVILQQKMFKRPIVAIFHAMIFYGFLTLFITSVAVSIHIHSPYKIFKGPLYAVLSFSSELAGLLILTGVLIAFIRRYCLKLVAKSFFPYAELTMYGWITLLVLGGYGLAIIRISETNLPAHEALYSFVSFSFAKLLYNSHWHGTVSLVQFYQGLWLFHMGSTMLFLIALFSTKFSHIFYAAYNNLIATSWRFGAFAPLESEVIKGLQNDEGLSKKMRLDLLSCVECGRCSDVCPATLAGSPLSPQVLMSKLRSTLNSNTEFFNPDNYWDSIRPLLSDSELEGCTTCGACMESCPMGVELLPFIIEARRFRVLTQNKTISNPWEALHATRVYPLLENKEVFDYLYFVGCAGSYNQENQIVVETTLSLFKKAGISVGVIGLEESCCGDPMRRKGDETSFQKLVEENIKTISSYQFKAIVSHCPHCLHTLGSEYHDFGAPKWSTLHHSELLASLIDEKKLTPLKPLSITTTFHDPCYLARYRNNISSVRSILKSIPSLKLIEMKNSKKETLCCGMGGREIKSNKIEQLTTACSYCLINFNTEGNKVDDVATILAKSIF